MRYFSAILLLTAAIPLSAADRWVEKTLKSLTLDEKIGQMLMPGNPLGAFRNLDSDELTKMRSEVVDYHAGGYHVFGGDPAAVALIVNELQKMARVPLRSVFTGKKVRVRRGSIDMGELLADFPVILLEGGAE